MTGAVRPRHYQGWPLLANGFRPFFLLGSIYAGLGGAGLVAGVLRRTDAGIRICAARLACA